MQISLRLPELNTLLTLRVSSIAQEFSWGRLQISETAFCALLQHLGVFDEFVNVVRSRGLKIREGERVWYGFRSYHPTFIDPDYASRHGRSCILEQKYDLVLNEAQSCATMYRTSKSTGASFPIRGRSVRPVLTGNLHPQPRSLGG